MECHATWEFKSPKKLTVEDMIDICWGCDACASLDVSVEGIE